MQSNKWSTAAMYGLLLALITVLHSLITSVFEPPLVINIILWAAKFAGSLWVLYYFMKEYSKPFEVFTYKDGFRFGFMICLFSSVICASFTFLQITLIFPDLMANQMETVMNAMQSSNSDSMEAFEKIQGILPQLILVFSLVYYIIFGAIASSIIANYTKKGDIFANTADSQF
ncbi:MAG TPA: hypothetical protein DF637_07550 [Rikenellaceae bacterium]|nr:MAG: hypothetical protein A2322_08685 [Bacteroidetes bacterium RIFOXYB2_FULL_39_7]OFZ11860.1 MAG: hypothetical protein A2465_06420 [Bacteroidetes bacterium RIFOXYC2_FULL_39_11]HCT94131.1 hypothetical protein [Rikenellaceae bacterium]HCV16171.1 hypothetical protein [Rikenellaceae bacterium]